MRKRSTFVLALWAGCLVEAILCGVAIYSFFSGGFGPCGPTGDFPWWLIFVHHPGSWLAEFLLPHPGLSRVPIIVATTAVQFSVVAFVAIEVSRRFHGKDPSR